MKPHRVSEIRKGIRDVLVRWGVSVDGVPVDGRITEEIMGALLAFVPVEHFNRGAPESELVLVEKAEWDKRSCASYFPWPNCAGLTLEDCDRMMARIKKSLEG